MTIKNEIINILVRRDDMSQGEAAEFLEQVLAEVNAAIAEGDHELAEKLWMEDLGLEVDYLMELLY